MPPPIRRDACETRVRHMELGLLDRIFAKMKDRGREHRAGVAVANAGDQMVEFADAARAMTGTLTASATLRVSSMSKPHLAPSRSIEVSRISPAPRQPLRGAKSTASMPVARRPPWVKISQRFSPARSVLTRLASIATTMHCAPNFSAARARIRGSQRRRS